MQLGDKTISVKEDMFIKDLITEQFGGHNVRLFCIGKELIGDPFGSSRTLKDYRIKDGMTITVVISAL